MDRGAGGVEMDGVRRTIYGKAPPITDRFLPAIGKRSVKISSRETDKSHSRSQPELKTTNVPQNPEHVYKTLKATHKETPIPTYLSQRRYFGRHRQTKMPNLKQDNSSDQNKHAQPKQRSKSQFVDLSWKELQVACQVRKRVEHFWRWHAHFYKGRPNKTEDIEPQQHQQDQNLAFLALHGYRRQKRSTSPTRMADLPDVKLLRAPLHLPPTRKRVKLPETPLVGLRSRHELSSNGDVADMALCRRVRRLQRRQPVHHRQRLDVARETRQDLQLVG